MYVCEVDEALTKLLRRSERTVPGAASARFAAAPVVVASGSC